MTVIQKMREQSFEIISLKRQLEDLRAENAFFREQLRPSTVVPRCFQLQPRRKKLFRIIFERSPSVVSFDAIISSVWGISSNPADEHLVFVHHCLLRKNLRPFGVEIITHRGEGFSMPLSSAQRVKELQERELAS